jgi:precorrin-3B C17-methyltransferase
VVGIGPGGEEDLTCRASRVIDEADLLVGYTTYLKLVQKMSCYHGQEIYTTGMTREVERVQYALEAARRGLRVAVISSGDAGVYGMAGLVLEVMESTGQCATLEIIPGIPAANTAAAMLGAPLMQDYATISLSDLLTPLPDILTRVEAAARADFVIVFYNPRSKSREEPWDLALSVLKKHRKPETPVGLVSSAGRAGESVKITDLEHMDMNEPDMLTTVIVGNSRTRVINGRMITPRGYEL